MILGISEFISKLPPVASIIISIALMLFGGFLMTRLTKLLKLPNVTAYILVGIILGSLHIISDETIKGMEFLPDIALAFIAFSTGEFFKLEILKKNGAKVIIITLCEALIASILVFILTYFILHLNLAFSIVLSALASATAPASTMMTIRQTKAKGDFVNTLLQVVALDDIVGLVAYSVAISIASTSVSGLGFSFWSIMKPILINLIVLILGGFFGFILNLILKKRSNDNRLIIAIAMLFLFCGLCALLDISPLLGCMSMGMVYINTSKDEKLFKQLNYFSPPILLLFFVRSGLTFDISSLTSKGMIGPTPLILIAVLYFIIRIIGKYSGAYLGCFIAKKDKLVKNNLGLALIPQAGVAIGLAALSARTFSMLGFPDVGNALQTIILASSILYELIGPGCAKLSLYLSHSYSNNIEELVPIDEISDNKNKSNVQILIDRIKKIQSTIPEHDISEEEIAYNEAVEEQYNYSYMQYNYKNKNWRKRK